jgi:hypothetical protein
MMKCLWCNDELPDGVLFCKKEIYSNCRPIGCGDAYLNMLKTQQKLTSIELTDFEKGVIELVKKFKLKVLSSTPINLKN